MLCVASLLTVKVGNGLTDATGFVTVEATPAWTTQRAAYDHWVTCQVSTLTWPRNPTAVSLSGRFHLTPTNDHLPKRGRSDWNVVPRGMPLRRGMSYRGRLNGGKRCILTQISSNRVHCRCRCGASTLSRGFCSMLLIIVLGLALVVCSCGPVI